MSKSASTDLALWLARLEALNPAKIDLGLNRIHAVLGNLDLSKADITLTVAGTNGKGSVTNFLDVTMRANGYRTGLYTSPHLSEFGERIRIDGQPAAAATLVDAFEAVEAARGETSLSYFEYTTLAAFVAFARSGCQAWVLEVGLGGRLDAVNALDSDAALVTNIGFDHQAWLGDTLEMIGTEKAGVFRPGKPAIVGMRNPPESVTGRATQLNSTVRVLGRDFDHVGDDKWQWQSAQRTIEGLPSMAGLHQRDNVSAGLAMLQSINALPEDDRVIAHCIQQSNPPGRLERRMAHGFTWLLDVAHNVEAVTALATILDQSCAPVTMIFGAMQDKPVVHMLEVLDSHVDQWIAVAAPVERALPAPALARTMAATTGKPALIAGTPESGMRHAVKVAPEKSLIVVAGSFPVVGAVRARLY
ncbi:MAG: folylpolyglutamate synthase/dihydrofolate synthase family protein [Woeseiaceae bacterium]